MAESLDPQALELLDTTREVHVHTATKRLPIWSVVVDGDAYVRSYHGERGAWYRRALRDGHVLVEGIEANVEPERDEALNERISQAFRDKYGERSPRPTEEMVSPEVTATTLRLTRR
jgi:hypothetical protein